MRRSTRRLGRYELVKRLGRGGMGEVYLARLSGPFGFEKLLVVKKVLTEYADDTRYVAMFLAEARIAARLSHPNLVQVYDLARADDGYFLAMELVHGASLEDFIVRAREAPARPPVAALVDTFAKLASGLAYAHDACDSAGPLRLVHRDVTPRNILLGFDGEPRLIDFGIAKSRLQTEVTKVGVIKGRVAYMSPEQSCGERLDRRTDVFSLGVCLYEACTLHHPFLRQSSLSTVQAICRDTPPPPSRIRADLAPLDPILARALAKEPARRHPTCAEVAYDLLELVHRGQLPVAERPLTDLLAGLFAPELRAHTQLLRELREHPAPPASDAPDACRPHRVGPTATPDGRRRSRASPPRAGRWPALALGLLVVMLVTLLASVALAIRVY